MLTILLLAVLLSWQDNSDNENGFVVERTMSGDCVSGFEVIGYTEINVTTFVDPVGVYPACYRVAAFNTEETSAYSNTAQIAPPPPPPPTPTPPPTKPGKGKGRNK